MIGWLTGLSPAAWLAVFGIAWGVLAPIGAWAWTATDAYFDKRRAVAAAITSEQKACNQRVKDIELELNNAADKRVTEALDAASRLEPTPVAGSPELQRVCDSDPNCRDRKR